MTPDRATAAGDPPGGKVGIDTAGVAGIGTDLVDIERFRAVLTRQPGIRRRIFRPAEQAYADRARDPVPRYAARFAAKEAVMKALGVGLGQVAMRDIEVLRSDRGQPSVALHGRAAAIARSQGISRWHLSLTHSQSAAHAVAMAE